jgi:FMN phosphatase YigB (HAD superfamily)
VPFLSSPIEKAPRAALFDVGRVIIRLDLSRSLAALGLRKGMSHIQVLRELESDRRWADWQEGRMPPRDWHAHLSKKLHFSYNFEEFCAIWNSVLEAETILPDTFFDRLSKNCSLALLSNTDPIHVAHFEATYSFVRFFPVRVYSCRVGSSKPSPMIYHHALREVATLPEETLFIDDMQENVLAAAALGIHAFHFTTPEDLLSEFKRIHL